MENEYEYGICKECGKPIEFYEYTLTGLEFWFCQTCYFLRWPRARKPSAETLGWASHIPGEESYQYLKEFLYSQPHHYERSFRTLRPFVLLLQCFETLKALLDYIAGEYDQTIRRCLKDDLKEALAKYPHLFPETVEILTFVLWDELVEKYGRGERFSEGYWDLIRELESCR